MKRTRSRRSSRPKAKPAPDTPARPSPKTAGMDEVAELRKQLAEARAQLKARRTSKVRASGRSIGVGGDVTESTLVVAEKLIVQMSGAGAWHRTVLGRPAGGKSEKERLQAYLKYLHERHVFVEFRGLGMTGRVPLKLALEEIYVPARARLEMPDGETATRTLRVTGRGLPQEDVMALGERMGSPQPVASLLENHAGLVVLGDPGSGKTSFLKHLAVRYGTGRAGEDRLPVYLPLAAYAVHLSQHRSQAGGVKPLREFIVEYYQEQGVRDIAGLLDRALGQGRALVLLDGLDETRHQTLRRQVVDAVVSLFLQYRESGNKFVMTSRIVGYAAVRPNVPGLEECWLSDFDEQDIETFAERWTRAVERRERGAGRVTDHEAETRRRDLLQAVANNPGVQRLAASPILLTILALMQKAGVRLPDRRAKLYERCLDAMLSTWNAARNIVPLDGEARPASQTLKVLGPLALWMHTNDDGYGLVPAARLQGELRAIFLRRKGHRDPQAAPGPDQEEADKEAGDFLKDVHDQCSLLLERAPGRYGFLHQSFQEYLAGVGLVLRESDQAGGAGQPDGVLGTAGVIRAMQECLASRESREVWREPLLLAAGYVGLVQSREAFSADMLRGWMQTGREGLLLAGEAVADLGREAVGHACLQEIRAQLERLRDDRTVPALARADAARWIGHLGDHRPGVGVVARTPGSTPPMRPDFAWCGPDPADPRVPFPPGPFLMGGDAKAFGTSKEPFECHRVRRPFFIARYPVTVRQFQCFVDDGGYANEAYWPGPARVWLTGGAKDWDWIHPILQQRYLKRRFPIHHPEDSEPAFQAPNSPRVGISWFEADAYVRWLADRFDAEEWGLGPGWKPMLASEVEWELAARWDGHGKQRVLPWALPGGDETLQGRCNYHGADIARTSAVGMFSPEGDAFCGAADLMGNVWEWCRDLWVPLGSLDHQRRYNEADDDESSEQLKHRVLRGGSWFLHAPVILRCAARSDGPPGFSSHVIGFRVVCVRVLASVG